MSKLIISVTAGSEVTGIISDGEEVTQAYIETEGSDDAPVSMNVEFKPDAITDFEREHSFTSEDL
jgi:hypothetical protein